MNKIFFTLSLLFVATTAMAQSPKGYNGVSVSYQSNYCLGTDAGDSDVVNGFGVDYLHGFAIAGEIPLYLETGAGLSFGFDSENNIDVTVIDLKVPVNISYSIACGNSFVISPFAGINAKYYVLGNMSYGDENYNLFSKDDMHALGILLYEPFHIGWQAGVNFQYNKFWLGVSYSRDFTEAIIDSKVYWSRLSVSVGFKF